MHRRSLLGATLAAAGAAFASARRPAEATEVSTARVVYHLSDLDRVGFVMGNIGNHYDGMGGPQNVTIALVVHGPALRAFRLERARPEIARGFGGFVKDGLQMHACGNTMAAQNIALRDLLPGFAVAEKGGVVRLAELQAQGYAYLRP